MNTTFKYILLLVLLTTLFTIQCGCIQCPPRMDYQSDEVPTWIYEIPQKKGFVYAWGSAGKSISFSETKRVSLDNAKKALARYFGVQVDFQTLKFDVWTWDQMTRIQALVDWQTLEPEIIDTFMDDQGKAGLGYQYYTLVRLAASR